MTDARTIIANHLCANIGDDWEELCLDDRERFQIEADAIIAALSAGGKVIEDDWQPIETAPKDGTVILVLAAGYDWGPCWDGDEKVYVPPSAHLAKWGKDGTSWVDQSGTFDGEICGLAVTGVWFSGGGWFQPNEVTHWRKCPPPPAATPSTDPGASK